MVASMFRFRPGRCFATGGPLPWHVPMPDQLRLRRILQVEDAHHVADVARQSWRAIEIAAIEGKPMHAGTDGFPARDQLGIRWIARIVDAEAALPARLRLTHLLMIDHHDAVLAVH